MIEDKTQAYGVLRRYNAWWAGGSVGTLPKWKRSVFREIQAWIEDKANKRALLINGARQVGKTTLLLQVVEALLEDGVKGNQILYVTMDHPLIRQIGLEGVIELWKEYESVGEGTQYILVDEVHYEEDWCRWVKHQVDFVDNCRIIVTGSAMTLDSMNQESAVGRLQTMKLGTLSFRESIEVQQVSGDFESKGLSGIHSLEDLWSLSEGEFVKIGEEIRTLMSAFNGYLVHGGFPQIVKMDKSLQSLTLLREDIVDRVLRRDMTTLFGVRRVQELEQLFLYLCMHEGGIIDVSQISRSLEINRPTIMQYLNLLESTHLIYRLSVYGKGKVALKGKPKCYITDPGIASSMLLRGKSILEDSTGLGAIVESVVYRHLWARSYLKESKFSYWQGKKGKEVDIIAEREGWVMPIEVKYRELKHTQGKDLKGILEFCKNEGLERGLVVTKDPADIGLVEIEGVKLMKLPGAGFCYWISNLKVELRAL